MRSNGGRHPAAADPDDDGGDGVGRRAADARQRRRRRIALYMGLVIFSGLSIGTLFTLFVVPAVYLLIATDHSRRAERSASQLPVTDDAVGRI